MKAKIVDRAEACRKANVAWDRLRERRPRLVPYKLPLFHLISIPFDWISLDFIGSCCPWSLMRWPCGSYSFFTLHQPKRAGVTQRR